MYAFHSHFRKRFPDDSKEKALVPFVDSEEKTADDVKPQRTASERRKRRKRPEDGMHSSTVNNSPVLHFLYHRLCHVAEDGSVVTDSPAQSVGGLARTQHGTGAVVASAAVEQRRRATRKSAISLAPSSFTSSSAYKIICAKLFSVFGQRASNIRHSLSTTTTTTTTTMNIITTPCHTRVDLVWRAIRFSTLVRSLGAVV